MRRWCFCIMRCEIFCGIARTGPSLHSEARSPPAPKFQGELWHTEITMMEYQSQAFPCPCIPLMECSLLRAVFPLRVRTRLPLALIGAAHERIKSRIICCSLGITHLFPLGVVTCRLGFSSFTEMIPFKAVEWVAKKFANPIPNRDAPSLPG